MKRRKPKLGSRRKCLSVAERMPAATLGLTTYRWNNNLKSILLLLAFPLLLLALFGGIFFVFGILTIGTSGSSDSPGPFQIFGLQPVLGTEGPADLALS